MLPNSNDPNNKLDLSATQAFEPKPVEQVDAALPSMIDGFPILNRLGEGGMGTVFLAQQQQPHRQVALKIVRPSLLSPDVLKRFGSETEALGRLQHEGIAQIYHAGSADMGKGGTWPYFTMEYVDGVPLTEFAQSRKLTFTERLRLLAQVSTAVHYAHQQGVIHRDLKPSNILVTSEGKAKVLDFGLARIVAADSSMATLETQAGQILGTLPYMSPEQAGGTGHEVDTRTDVYSLGVIGYELLAGHLPYDVVGATLIEAVRVIREVDPKPLSQVNRSFTGDVETIIGKALAKEKERRYPSASELAADIDRYLNNEPISARPATAWYQVTKFTRRNRALVGGVAAVLLCLVLGVIGTSAAMVRAWQAEEQAVTNQQLAQASASEEATARARAEQARVAERNARIAAQAAEKAERQARNEAEQSRRQAEEAEKESRQRLEMLLVKDGADQADRGDFPGALLSYVEAMRVSDDPVPHKQRISSLMLESPVLEHMLPAYWCSRHAVSDDRSRVIVSGKVYDPLQGKVLRDIATGEVAITGDGKLAVVANRNATCYVYDLATGDAPIELPIGGIKESQKASANFEASYAGINPHSSRVMVAGEWSGKNFWNQGRLADVATVWNWKTQEELLSISHAGSKGITHYSFTPYGRYIFVSRDEDRLDTKVERMLQPWSVAEKKPIHEPWERGSSAAWYGDVALFGSDPLVLKHHLYKWNMRTGERKKLSDFFIRGGQVAVAPHNRLIAIGADKFLWLMKPYEELPSSTPRVHRERISDPITFTPKAEQIVTVAGKRAYIWNHVGSPAPATWIEQPDQVWAAYLTPDASRLVTFGKDDFVRTWRLKHSGANSEKAEEAITHLPT